jgi:hypothetical protein
MSSTIVVEGKVLGQKRPLFTGWQIDLPPTWGPGGDRIRLRDLITRVVVEEVDAFRQRQEQRRLARIMSPAEIQAGAASGKVDPGERDLGQAVDTAEAIGTALQAFEDGLYFVFIDDLQQTDLDSEVHLSEESHVTFIRLVALVGG